jgi:hypothetical protein
MPPFDALKLQRRFFATIKPRVTLHVTRQAAKHWLRFAHVLGPDTIRLPGTGAIEGVK